jgi:hypothetical protein
MTVPPKLQSKVAGIIRRLLSNHDREVLAAVYALKRLADIHEIAEHIESPVITKDELNKVYEAGRVEGIAEAKRRQEEAIRSIPPADETDWADAARKLYRFKQFLDLRHRGFIDDMAERADNDDEPTEKQQRYLLNLYVQLKDISRSYKGTSK